MVNNYISTPIEINEIKNILITKYQELFIQYPNEIINLFNNYGYIKQSKELAKKKYNYGNIHY